MRLSKSITRQLASIESGLARREQPEETQRQQWERRQQEATRRHWERYFDLINQVLQVMDTDFGFMALKELEAAPDDNLYKIQGRYEFGVGNLLPPLAAGVCLVASRLMHQEELSHPVPLALPASVCHFLQEHGAEVFRKTEYDYVGTARRQVAAPQFKWLSGDLKCKKCYYPVPYKSGTIGKWNSPDLSAVPNSPDLPFKTCPVCQGELFWVGG